MTTIRDVGSHRGVVPEVLNSEIIENEFEHNSLYYVDFRIDIIGERMS